MKGYLIEPDMFDRLQCCLKRSTLRSQGKGDFGTEAYVSKPITDLVVHLIFKIALQYLWDFPG